MNWKVVKYEYNTKVDKNVYYILAGGSALHTFNVYNVNI